MPISVKNYRTKKQCYIFLSNKAQILWALFCVDNKSYFWYYRNMYKVTRFFDKNGDPINGNDLVLLDVYEPKLKHTGPTSMLGRVKIGEVYSPWSETNYLLKIDMGEGLAHRQRHGSNVELAIGFEEEFRQQIKDYEPFLMLDMFEW